MRSDLFCRKKTKIEMEKAPASALDLIARPIDADVSCDARCLERPILTTTRYAARPAWAETRCRDY
jgi:hypothetical protein